MTYREFLQIEKYITEIEALKKLNIDGNQLQLKAENLNNRILSNIKGYKPQGLSWYSAYVNLSDGLGGYSSINYNRDQICNLMDIMQATLQGILNSLPYYDEICDLGKDISYGHNISNSTKSKCDFIVEKVKKYSRNIKFEQPIINARDSLLAGDKLSEEQLDTVFRTLLLDIEEYRKSLLDDRRDLKEAINQPQQNIFNLITNGGSASANASASAQVNVDISVQIEQTIEKVKEACLSPEEEAAILGKLDELKGIAKVKNIRTRWDKVKGVFKWLAEQSLQVAGWLVPLVSNLIAGA